MSNLKRAINILEQGGIVIFPTDTAFGIGCRIDRSDSVRRLFKIRRRPFSQATPVLAASIEMAKEYFKLPLPNNVRHLMDEYWPGALTIVYPCKTKKVPLLVRGGGNNLGVRMPSHKVALDLIRNINVPLIGSSANFHGSSTPYQFEDLDSDLVKMVDYVVEGKCQLGKVSTVLDCSVTPWRVIRQGAVEIEGLLGNNKEVGKNSLEK